MKRTVIRNLDVFWKDDFVLIDSSGKVIKLNQLTKRVLELSDGTRTVEELVQIISHEKNLREEELRKVIKTMIDKKLLILIDV
ncbi:MAG: PqqD family protein [Thaumarchaeota archaeon]|nr:PqqD family protein [Nitrososphaerota archaeon]